MTPSPTPTIDRWTCAYRTAMDVDSVPPIPSGAATKLPTDDAYEGLRRLGPHRNPSVSWDPGTPEETATLVLTWPTGPEASQAGHTTYVSIQPYAGDLVAVHRVGEGGRGLGARAVLLTAAWAAQQGATAVSTLASWIGDGDVPYTGLWLWPQLGFVASSAREARDGQTQLKQQAEAWIKKWPGPRAKRLKAATALAAAIPTTIETTAEAVTTCFSEQPDLFNGAHVSQFEDARTFARTFMTLRPETKDGTTPGTNLNLKLPLEEPTSLPRLWSHLQAKSLLRGAPNTARPVDSRKRRSTTPPATPTRKRSRARPSDQAVSQPMVVDPGPRTVSTPSRPLTATPMGTDVAATMPSAHGVSRARVEAMWENLEAVTITEAPLERCQRWWGFFRSGPPPWGDRNEARKAAGLAIKDWIGKCKDPMAAAWVLRDAIKSEQANMRPPVTACVAIATALRGRLEKCVARPIHPAGGGGARSVSSHDKLSAFLDLVLQDHSLADGEVPVLVPLAPPPPPSPGRPDAGSYSATLVPGWHVNTAAIDGALVGRIRAHVQAALPEGRQNGRGRGGVPSPSKFWVWFEAARIVGWPEATAPIKQPPRGLGDPAQLAITLAADRLVPGSTETSASGRWGEILSKMEPTQARAYTQAMVEMREQRKFAPPQKLFRWTVDSVYAHAKPHAPHPWDLGWGRPGKRPQANGVGLAQLLVRSTSVVAGVPPA